MVHASTSSDVYTQQIETYENQVDDNDLYSFMTRSDATVIISIQNQLAGYLSSHSDATPSLKAYPMVAEAFKMSNSTFSVQQLSNNYLARLHKFQLPNNVAWLMKLQITWSF